MPSDLLRQDLRRVPVPVTSWSWAALGAISFWLGFPAALPSFPLLALLLPLAIWRLALFAPNVWAAFRWGLLTFFAGAIAALYWLAMPVSQVGGLPWPAAFACAALIAFALAIQGGLFAIGARWLRFYAPCSQAIMLAILWYLLEYLFALAAGFPWLPLAGALAQWPFFIQPASIFGAYLTGALWLCVLLFIGAGRFIAALLLGASLSLLCCWMLYENPEQPWPSGEGTIAALMVEGNVDQNQKWTKPFQELSLRRYLRLTEEGLKAHAQELAGEKPLLIWPETALPFFYETSKAFAGELQDAVRRMDCPLLFGAPGVDMKAAGKERIFNRAFLLNGDGELEGHYDKEHLVPFGEYLPAWLKLDFLEALLQGVGIYEAGVGGKPLRMGGVALGVLICYEGIFPWLAQSRIDSGANILVDISNDGWFGLSPAARQHLYLTVSRCVEQGRYMFRATNTGISAVIDARGRVVLRGGQFATGSLLGRGRMLEGRTLYHRMALWWPCVCGLIFAILCVADRKKHVPIK